MIVEPVADSTAATSGAAWLRASRNMRFPTFPCRRFGEP
jgi:hypothetical protein